MLNYLFDLNVNLNIAFNKENLLLWREKKSFKKMSYSRFCTIRVGFDHPLENVKGSQHHHHDHHITNGTIVSCGRRYSPQYVLTLRSCSVLLYVGAW